MRTSMGRLLSALGTRLATMKTFMLIILIVTLALMTPFVVDSQSNARYDDTDLQEASSKAVVVNVPAVTGQKGKLIKIIVKPSEKPGVVFTGSVDVGEDTFASAWTAFLVASLLAGKSPFDDGIEITILTDSDNVEGPSASLAIAMASYIIKGDHPEPSVLSRYSITGAISLDGASVVVGGTPEKLQATLSSGLDKMILPASNTFLFEGDNIRTSAIVPVYGVLDGLDAVYGRNPAVLPVSTVYPPVLSEFLREIGGSFIEKARQISSDLGNMEELSVVEHYINESYKAMQQGRLYTHASLAYTAYLAAISVRYEKSSGDELEGIYRQVSGKLENIKKALESYEKELYSKGRIGQFELEILAITESRAWMCEALLSEYKNSALGSEVRKNSLIQAIARCETAETWMKALELDWEGQPTLRIDLLEKTIDEYQVFLDHAITYVASAIEMDVVPPQVRVYFEEIKDLADRIRESSRRGNPGLRLGLSVELGSRLSAFLTQMNTIHPATMERYVSELWRNLAVLTGHLASHGRVSLMSSLYAEYAQYPGHDPASRVALLDTAIASVQPLLIYSLLEESGSAGVDTAGVREIMERLSMAEGYRAWLIVGFLSTLIGLVAISFYNGRVD